MYQTHEMLVPPHKDATYLFFFLFLGFLGSTWFWSEKDCIVWAGANWMHPLCDCIRWEKRMRTRDERCGQTLQQQALPTRGSAQQRLHRCQVHSCERHGNVGKFDQRYITFSRQSAVSFSILPMSSDRQKCSFSLTIFSFL